MCKSYLFKKHKFGFESLKNAKHWFLWDCRWRVSEPPFNKRALKHPRIQLLGMATTDDLVRPYTDALFTLSMLTHEPFGYVFLESRTCGTPIIALTFKTQANRSSMVTQRGFRIQMSNLYKEAYDDQIVKGGIHDP